MRMKKLVIQSCFFMRMKKLDIQSCAIKGWFRILFGLNNSSTTRLNSAVLVLVVLVFTYILIKTT